MVIEAMPTPAAVKPLAKREADFSARPSVRFGSVADLTASGRHVRSAPKSGRRGRTNEAQICSPMASNTGL